MNRYARWGFALAFLPLAACAGSPPPPPAAAPAPAGPPPLAAADATFIQDAAQGGLAEVQSAQLALTKTHSPKVTAFANKMIADHTPANDQLKQIATAKGATVPTAPNDMQTQQMTKLQGESGHMFARDYLADQLADHKMMLQMYQTEAASGTDPDLKKFASDNVPVIQSHIDMASSTAPKHSGMRHHHHVQAS